MHAPGPQDATSEMHLGTSALLQHVHHGFTNRHGGTSTAEQATLDLKLGVHAQRASVRENRKRVLAALGCPTRVFVAVKQVHEDHVVEVAGHVSPHIEADGIWTRDKSVVLAILTADCVPILLADKDGSIVAAVHAGWRGTQSRVVSRMVERLASGAGVEPNQLVAVMGPAIGPCCFDIGNDTATQLREAYPAALEAIRARKGRKATADLWRLNRQALLEAGVPDANIEALQICTACTKDHYSYRRDHGETGRQAGVIALR